MPLYLKECDTSSYVSTPDTNSVTNVQFIFIARKESSWILYVFIWTQVYIQVNFSQSFSLKI